MKTDNLKSAAGTTCEPDIRDFGCLGSKTAVLPPLKLKTILVPVDFSDCSKAALQYAINLAEQFNAGMIFLHVLPVNYVSGWEPEFPSYDPLIEGDLEKEAKLKLLEMIKKTVPNGITTRAEIRYGAPSIEIMNVARELQADLIIMSTHGHTGRVHAFLGSVAGDVTRLAPCPVLVVRRHEAQPKSDPTNPFKTGQKPPQEKLKT